MSNATPLATTDRYLSLSRGWANLLVLATIALFVLRCLAGQPGTVSVGILGFFVICFFVVLGYGQKKTVVFRMATSLLLFFFWVALSMVVIPESPKPIFSPELIRELEAAKLRESQ